MKDSFTSSAESGKDPRLLIQGTGHVGVTTPTPRLCQKCWQVGGQCRHECTKIGTLTSVTSQAYMQLCHFFQDNPILAILSTRKGRNREAPTEVQISWNYKLLL